MASMGAIGNSSGARPAAHAATMRPRDVNPCRCTAASLATTNAAAPSAIVDALAAVIVPSAAKLGFNVGIRAKSTRAGSSSVSMVSGVPPRPGRPTGTISPAKRPSAMAACARR